MLRYWLLILGILTSGMSFGGADGLTPISSEPMADPFIFRDGTDWYISGTRFHLLQGRNLAKDSFRRVDMHLDLGPTAKRIWSFTLYRHTDGSYHAYPTLCYGNWKTEVGHLVPEEGQKWTDGHPITRWRLDKVMVGDSKNGQSAYDGKVIRDGDGTLYLVYVGAKPGTPGNCLWAHRMLNPGELDPSFKPRILIQPEGYRSEDRNPGFIQLIEGANITRIAGKYVMCYSVGDFMLDNYKLALAYSDTLIPPEGKYYQKLLIPDPRNLWGNDAPGKEVKYLLQSQIPDWPNYCRTLVAGPGVGSIVNVDEQYRLVFHGWLPDTDQTKRKGSQRHTWMIPLKVRISGETPMDQWIQPVLPPPNDPLDMRPPLRDLPDKSGPIGKRMHYPMLRQFGADLREQLPDFNLPEKFVSAPDGTRYRERDIRPIVSLISGGAVSVRYGDFDTQTVGISRADAERILVSLIPVFAAHHVVNNPEKKSWWWGDEWQSAFWAGELARGAWILYDRLSPEARRDTARMIEFEADRFIDTPAPFNEFGDTKAEENAWNSQILVLAACMLPNHPHRAAWEDKAREYMVTAFASPQDLGQERMIDGKPLKDWLRGANVHGDYTLENHNIFHLDYLATYGLNVENAVAYGLAGLPVPESALFNAANCRAISELFTLPTGCMMYPMSTDWSLYRHDIALQAQSPGGLLPDPVGQRCLIWGLDSLQRADKPGPPQNLFGFNFECTALHILSKAWMIRRLYGDGPEPASEDEAQRRLSGTRLLPNGRVVVCRSVDGIASFSWFNTGRQFCGLVMPMSSAYTTTAGVRSLIGTIGGKIDPIRIIRREIGPMSGGFSVGLSLERGPEYGVKERVMMLALPDGRVVYGEWFDPDTTKDEGNVRTGLLYLQNNPFWLQDDKLRVYHPSGVWEGDPAAWEMDGDKLPWMNVANRLGIVLRGAKHISYSDRQLALNSGEAPACMTAVFYPNADREATARANDLVQVSTQPDGLLHVDLGDTEVVFNPTDQPVDVAQDGNSITLRPLHGAMIQRPDEMSQP